jgi:uncharacterized protein (DUF362 family)
MSRSSRRKFIAGTAGGVLLGSKALRADWQAGKPQVFIGKADAYDRRLVDSLRRGLLEIGFGPERIKGKSVLLKPNLVEPTRKAPHINTHPMMVFAAAEVFRGWDAKEVVVAEGQGHCRDTVHVLEESGLAPILADVGLEFVDLNHDDVYQTPNKLGATKLEHLLLPKTLKRPDVFVSMPKMKLHHWAGVTLSMKNLFGVMPSICYGWPKNVLHQHGIEKSIMDINATVMPDLAIVDGIVGMEGDGPIMGTPKQANVFLVGDNVAAVDATATRLMGLDPRNIVYLNSPGTAKIGPVAEKAFDQRGEPWRTVVCDFEYPNHPHYKQFLGVRRKS